MPVQYWVSLLNAGAPWQTNAGTLINTATTATISPQSGGSNDFTLPPNYFYPGITLRVEAGGFVTTTGTQTTATFLLACNKSGSYTTIATSGGLLTGTGSLTGLPWQLQGFINCTAVGSSGNTLSAQLQMVLATTVASQTIPTANTITLGLPNASGATATAIDTTSAQGIALRATLAGANATIQCTQFTIEALS